MIYVEKFVGKKGNLPKQLTKLKQTETKAQWTNKQSIFLKLYVYYTPSPRLWASLEAFLSFIDIILIVCRILRIRPVARQQSPFPARFPSQFVWLFLPPASTWALGTIHQVIYLTRAQVSGRKSKLPMARDH